MLRRCFQPLEEDLHGAFDQVRALFHLFLGIFSVFSVFNLVLGVEMLYSFFRLVFWAVIFVWDVRSFGVPLGNRRALSRMAFEAVPTAAKETLDVDLYAA